MNILYEDQNYIISIKPAGIISEEGGLPDILRKELNLKEIYCVHRLDKNVSGLIVYAKNKKTAAELTKQITEGTFRKEYIAVVQGIPEEPEGTMEDFLYHDQKSNKTFVVKSERRGVKKAILEYKVLDSYKHPGTDMTVSKVLIYLHTGRTHQIRAQFASRKMPVAGDRRYGSKINLENPELFSFRLTFTNPATGKNETYTLEL